MSGTCTAAERALIEAALKQSKPFFVAGAQEVAQERITPGVREELKMKIRALRRAERDYHNMTESLPQLALGGEHGLIAKLYAEIDEEVGP